MTSRPLSDDHDVTRPDGNGETLGEATTARTEGPWTLSTEVQALLNHPWFGTPTPALAPAGGANEGLGATGTDEVPMAAPGTEAGNGPAVEPFSLDATGPLAWWWAPADAAAFRIRATDAPAAWHDRLARCPTTFNGCLVQANAWLKRPVVWRVTPTTVQVVLLGLFRATFCATHPEGRFEGADPLTGWAPCAPEALFLALGDLHEALGYAVDQRGVRHVRQGAIRELFGKVLARVIEQTSRAVQQNTGARRLTFWRHAVDGSDGLLLPGAAPLVTAPWAFWPPMEVLTTHAPALRVARPGMALDSSLWASEVQPLGEQLQAGLRTVARHLARRFPLWQALHRSVQRLSMVSAVQSIGQRLPALAGWSARLEEHPNADLLLVKAMARGIRPLPYAWQEGLWVPAPFQRPALWRYALRGPRSTVRVALSHEEPSVGMTILTVMGTLPDGQRTVPTLALRAVPGALWTTVAQALNSDSTSDDWPVKLLASFLAAVAKRSWATAGLTLTDWVLQAQAVLEWAADLPACPIKDPSWTWTTVMDRFVVYESSFSPEWSGPLKAGHALGGRITPILSMAQGRMIGAIMKNCLKNEVGRIYLSDAQEGRGVLYRLDRRGKRSVLAIDWKNAKGWTIVDHASTGNSSPDPTLVSMAQSLLEFHRRHVPPRTWSRGAQRRFAGLQGNRSSGSSGAGATESLDHESLWSLFRPEWLNEVRRGRSWIRPWVGWTSLVKEVAGMDPMDQVILAVFVMVLMGLGFLIPAGVHWLFA